MSDLTIRGIGDDVLGRLRRDAEATGRSVEQVALHILTAWHGLLAGRDELVEQVRRVVDDTNRIPATMTPEKTAELERLRRNAASAGKEHEANRQSEPDNQGEAT